MDIIQKYFSEFSQFQNEQFSNLKDIYTKWNANINVISRKDIESLYLNHVLHSLSIAAITNFHPGTKIIDIGTGGGFPGIPLAIYFPEVEFLLVDSIAKKLTVVNEVASAIGLKNVTTRHTRAEDIKNEKFDFVVSRAVAPLKELWKWSKPLLKKGNTQDLENGLICLKGGDLSQEISESRLRPNAYAIADIFDEGYFKEKYIIHVPV